MIYESQLLGLIASWKQRSYDDVYDGAYLDALNDCIYELTEVVRMSLDQEMIDKYNEIDDPNYYLPPDDAMDYLIEEALRKQEVA